MEMNDIPHDCFNFQPIGFAKSCFLFKNGTPRQGSIAPKSKAQIQILKSIFTNPNHSLMDLGDFSHVWLLYYFHQNNSTHIRAKVTPPRLNGKRVGVFSTRSPHRPNPIGLTLAKLDAVKDDTIFVSGIDLIDGTPVLDIKPFIPEYDNLNVFHQKSKEERESDFVNTQNNNDAQANPPVIKSKDRFDSKQETSILLMKEEEIDFKSKEEKVNISSKKDKCTPFIGDEIYKSKKDEKYKSKKDEKDKSKKDEKDKSLKELINLSSKEGINNFESESSRVSEQEGCSNFSKHKKLKTCEGDNSTVLVNSQSTTISMKENENLTCNKSLNSEIKFPNWIKKDKTKPDVIFNQIATDQIKDCLMENFSAENSICPISFKTCEEVESLITSIVLEEPRSIYRREKCRDQLYYFTIGRFKVTAWFDNTDIVEILRVVPLSLDKYHKCNKILEKTDDLPTNHNI